MGIYHRASIAARGSEGVKGIVDLNNHEYNLENYS